MNSGLTTTRTVPIRHHPSGFVFVGTGGAGVFRSTEVTEPIQASVGLPIVNAAAGLPVEIPITATGIAGKGILSCQFVVKYNAPDSILVADSTLGVEGTILGASGWTVMQNAKGPNQIMIAAYGSAPLQGDGVLLKLKFSVIQQVDTAKRSSLEFSDFLFNNGTPSVVTTDGGVSIIEKVCGDADVNGLVQAYDAALVLREAIGPLPSPPPPLTSIGKVNADVDLNGKIEAYDAALILRHVLGLPMPKDVSSCFGDGDDTTSTSPLVQLNPIMSQVHHDGDLSSLQFTFAGVDKQHSAISLSMDLTLDDGVDNASAITFAGLPSGYLSAVNRLDSRHFRVAIVNPTGILSSDISGRLTVSNAALLEKIEFTNIHADNNRVKDTTIVPTVTGVSQKSSGIPRQVELVGSYPNPFNPSTRIVYQTANSQNVVIEIFNILGVRIRSLVNQEIQPGLHEVVWDATNDAGQPVASGQYYCRMRSGSYLKTIRLMPIK